MNVSLQKLACNVRKHEHKLCIIYSEYEGLNQVNQKSEVGCIWPELAGKSFYCYFDE